MAARRMHPETEFIQYDADAALRKWRREQGGGRAHFYNGEDEAFAEDDPADSPARDDGSKPAPPRLPGIGPHVDNGSCVTLIAMLSQRRRPTGEESGLRGVSGGGSGGSGRPSGGAEGATAMARRHKQQGNKKRG